MGKITALLAAALLLPACVSHRQPSTPSTGTEVPAPAAVAPAPPAGATTPATVPAPAAVPSASPLPATPQPSAPAARSEPPTPAAPKAAAAAVVKPAPKPVPSVAATPTAVAAPPVAAAPVATETPTLDLKSLEQRLRDTKAIGLFTKLALKNQVDDLLDNFRAHHRGSPKPPIAELRQNFDMLIMKVLALLQNGDPPLAKIIVSSRDALWGILNDPVKLSNI